MELKRRVRIVVDGRKAEATFFAHVDYLAQAMPGDDEVIFEVVLGAETRWHVLRASVEAGEPFYRAIRKLGWVAVPELVKHTEA